MKGTKWGSLAAELAMAAVVLDIGVANLIDATAGAARGAVTTRA